MAEDGESDAREERELREVDNRPWTMLLRMVAWKCGMSGEICEAWIVRTRTELEDVGVHNARDFVRSVLVVNRRLVEIGHQKVSQAMMNMLLAEVCEMMVWPE